MNKLVFFSAILASSGAAFAPQAAFIRPASKLSMAEEKAAPLVSGENLEMMLQDWDLPLVVDAYATW
jgi:hypothetical protein